MEGGGILVTWLLVAERVVGVIQEELLALLCFAFILFSADELAFVGRQDWE